MNYKFLDMESYKRKEHFKYFSGLAYPYVGLTVNVDITNLLKTIKEKQLPFFLTVCYCVSKAANRVPELRQRILGGKIIEYDYCQTSHTVALSDGTYCYCDLDSNKSFKDFLPYALNAQEKAKEQNSISEDFSESLGKIFISTIPWISYTAIINPTPMPADSNPRITWGKYFTDGEKVLLPMSILCHHALVDGLHIAKFYDYLNEEFTAIAEQNSIKI